MRLKELVRLLESKSSEEKMTRHRRIRMGNALCAPKESAD
jgi:hypothetical protein